MNTMSETNVAQAAPALQQVLWTTRDVLRYAGLRDHPLRDWVQRGWVTPAVRGRKQSKHQWSTFQLIGLVILSDTQQRMRREHTNIGGALIKAQMSALEGLSDLLLIADGADADLSESATYLIGRAVITREVTPEILEGIARVLAALDKRVQEMK